MNTKYFKRSEFKCKCGRCDRDAVDAELLQVLMRLRDFFGRPIHVNSGNRCEEYNQEMGGSKNSQHLYSKASDIEVERIESRVVFDTLDRWYPNTYGIGRYKTFTHLDVRKIYARWDNT